VRPARGSVFVLLGAGPLGGEGEVIHRPRGFQASATITLVLSSLVAFAVLALVIALTLTACGGSSGSATTGVTPAPTPGVVGSSAGTPAGGASPVAAPTTTAQVAAAYAAALSTAGTTSGFRSLIGLFAKDARFEDRAIGDLRVGTKAIADYFNYWFVRGPLTSTPRSELVGSDAAVVEEEVNGAAYGADVLQVHHGKIVSYYLYYNDAAPENPRFPSEPLKTPAAPADTQAAGQKLADAYLSALRALAPARLAPLYAGHVVYQDTVRDRRYVGPSAAIAAHAQMFALKGVLFQTMGVAAGPGWAAVMWKRTDRQGGKPPAGLPAEYTKWGRRPTIQGVTILEIRGGKIARETIYSDHIRTKY
jgi:hypothetical protein